jgi:hypothetical protein
VGFVLAALAVSYIGYELAAPLPFEEPRSRGRFKPAGTDPIWPVALINLFGIGLIATAVYLGSRAGGVGFLVTAIVQLVLYFIGISISLAVFLWLLTAVFGGGLSWRAGITILLFTVVGTNVITFTRYGGDFTLPALIERTGGVSATPWIGSIMIGPVYAGTLANFIIALVMAGCLLGSVVAMGRYLTDAPWSDRYDHGYRVSPGFWNLLLTAPFVILMWMHFAGVPEVTVPLGVTTASLSRSTLLLAVFVLPTVLTGAYILRRRAEPVLQRRFWS